MTIFQRSPDAPNRAAGPLELVTLAVNDENGYETDRVVAAHVHGVDGTELELESCIVENDYMDIWGPVCRFGPYRNPARRPHYAVGELRVGRITMPYFGYRQHVGNIMWDGFALAPRDIRRLVSYLIEKSKFSIDMAVCDTEWLPPHLRTAPPAAEREL